MLRIVLLLVAVTYVLGATIPNGLIPHSQGRIVGGADATIAAFPYQISLQRSGFHYCGGSIYGQWIIITAAHCLYEATADQLKIRAGSNKWRSGGVEVGVANFMKHENYNSNNVDNDIALLKLEVPLSFSSTIRPISLAAVAPPTGAAAVVTGWGKTDYESEDNSEVLQYVNLKIVDTKQCASSNYGYGNAILSSMICATAPGRSSCNEDSGGPLVSGGAQVGVVSWGEKCALANYPGVYANVAVLKQWIEGTASYLA